MKTPEIPTRGSVPTRTQHPSNPHPHIHFFDTVPPGTSHNGQANLLFCDGHVESARPTNWISASPAARARWKNDHEPHLETWSRP